MKTAFKLLTLVAALGMLTYSCKNDEVSLDEQANDSAESQAISDDVVEDITATTEDAIERFGQNGNGSFRGCATVSSTSGPGIFPDTILVDFGTTGCAGPGGRMYYGAIQIVRSGPANQAGSTRTVTPVNLYVDSIAVTGSHIVTYNGLNGSGQPYWTKSINHTLTFPDGTSATWSSTRVRTMIGGYSTPGIRVDDVFEISGTAQGVNRLGNSYTSTISTPLTVEVSCRWITSGVVSVSGPNGTRSLDYGAGSCDRLALVTGPNGNTRNIVLRR